MQIVIPSSGRSQSIRRDTLALFPTALVCVDESEAHTYSQVIDPAQLLIHPALSGLPSIRNWIIKNIEDDIIFMVDDDIIEMQSMVGRNAMGYRDSNVIMTIVENAADCAVGIGATIFGFNQSPRPMAFLPYDPISLAFWVGTAIGVTGKTLKWDERLRLRGDVDVCMQALLVDRIVFTDRRFHFLSRKRFKSKGGSASFRSAERDKQEVDYLKHKWGRYIEMRVNHGMGSGKTRSATIFTPSPVVKRRQR